MVVEQKRWYRWYALGLLSFLNILNYVDRNVIFGLFEPIKRDLAYTTATPALESVWRHRCGRCRPPVLRLSYFPIHRSGHRSRLKS